jgi:hypothetical protein
LTLKLYPAPVTLDYLFGNGQAQTGSGRVGVKAHTSTKEAFEQTRLFF